MSFYTNDSIGARSTAGVDLPAIMRQVYLWMTAGLIVTAGTAFYIASSGLALRFFSNPLLVIFTMIAYFILAFALQPIVMRASLAVGIMAYLAVTVLLGIMLSNIFLVGAQYVSGRVVFDPYQLQIIGYALVATAGTFGVMSVIGFVTKIDLSQFRSLFMVAIIGLIIASIVNMFFASSTLFWIINYAGVLIFTGLIAYDTQWIKRFASGVAMSSATNPGSVTVYDSTVQRIALIGAFHLYLDFVNLFIFILRILMGGGRRR